MLFLETFLGHFDVFSSGTKAILQRLHSPYGNPQVVQQDATFCVLYHSDYLNGYNRKSLMPLWVSYTVQPLVSPLFRAAF